MGPTHQEWISNYKKRTIQTKSTSIQTLEFFNLLPNQTRHAFNATLQRDQEK